MKQPKKLTRKQKELAAGNGLVPENWMLLDEDNISITLISKKSGKRKVIFK